MYRNRNRFNVRTISARIASLQVDLARARAELPAAEARVQAASAAHDALVAAAGDDWIAALLSEEVVEEAGEADAAEAALQQLRDAILDMEIEIDLLRDDLEYLRNLRTAYPGAY